LHCWRRRWLPCENPASPLGVFKGHVIATTGGYIGDELP